MSISKAHAQLTVESHAYRQGSGYRLSDDYTSALSRNQSPNSQFTEGVLFIGDPIGETNGVLRVTAGVLGVLLCGRHGLQNYYRGGR